MGGGEINPKTSTSTISTSFSSDDVIVDKPELPWLQATLGDRIAIYDHGGLIK